jgi:heme-degrading monooxygenase HmoA
MIARTWRGAVATADADAYADYMQDTGVAGYATTAGNQGVWMLRRNLDDDTTEFMMFTLWDSIEAVKAFAGPMPEQAIFYPEDDRFLIERDPVASHFSVVTYQPPNQQLHDGSRRGE